MKIEKLILCLIFLASLFFPACAKSKLPVKDLTIKTADGREITVKAEIADKADTRAKGFMERKSIPDGTGMLFVFESDQFLHFWMKNTPHPLSIAYIDSRGKIRDILDMTPYSLADVNSTVRVRYALEVPQGWFKKAGISEGDSLLLD